MTLLVTAHSDFSKEAAQVVQYFIFAVVVNGLSVDLLVTILTY